MVRMTLWSYTMLTDVAQEWVVASDVYDRTGVSMPSWTGQLGGFGITVKTRFGRSNPPYDRQWGADGQHQLCYRMSEQLAEA